MSSNNSHSIKYAMVSLGVGVMDKYVEDSKTMENEEKEKVEMSDNAMMIESGICSEEEANMNKTLELFDYMQCNDNDKTSTEKKDKEMKTVAEINGMGSNIMSNYRMNADPMKNSSIDLNGETMKKTGEDIIILENKKKEKKKETKIDEIAVMEKNIGKDLEKDEVEVMKIPEMNMVGQMEFSDDMEVDDFDEEIFAELMETDEMKMSLDDEVIEKKNEKEMVKPDGKDEDRGMSSFEKKKYEGKKEGKTDEILDNVIDQSNGKVLKKKSMTKHSKMKSAGTDMDVDEIYEENNAKIMETDEMDVCTSDGEIENKNKKETMKLDGKDNKKGIDNLKTEHMEICTDSQDNSVSTNSNSGTKMHLTDESFYKLCYTESDEEMCTENKITAGINAMGKIKSGKSDEYGNKKNEETEGNGGESEDSIDYDNSDEDDREESEEIFGGRFQFRGVIGTTRTSIIYSAFDQKVNSEVCLKSFKVNGHADVCRAEVHNLNKIQNSIFVPDLLDSVTLGQHHILVMSREKVSFDRLIFANGNKRFVDKTVLKIVRDMMKALEFLHCYGILHRDIRPSSLLISNDNMLQLSGYGQSVRIQNGYEKEPRNSFRKNFKNSYSTVKQLKFEDENESEDLLQSCYCLMYFLGNSEFSEAALTIETKDHFFTFPYSWMTESTMWIYPIIQLLLFPKINRSENIKIDFDTIQKEIKKLDPDVCGKAPYDLKHVNGMWRLF